MKKRTRLTREEEVKTRKKMRNGAGSGIVGGDGEGIASLPSGSPWWDEDSAHDEQSFSAMNAFKRLRRRG